MISRRALAVACSLAAGSNRAAGRRRSALIGHNDFEADDVVAGRDEDGLWVFIADEFKSTPVEGGSFQVWPADEAPAHVVAMLAQIQEREDRRLEVEGPRKSPLAEVIYGTVPAGYRQKIPAKTLRPGEYNVLVFAEQGQAALRFHVPA